MSSAAYISGVDSDDDGGPLCSSFVGADESSMRTGGGPGVGFTGGALAAAAVVSSSSLAAAALAATATATATATPLALAAAAEWRAVLDVDDNTKVSYYYHRATRVSSWTLPSSVIPRLVRVSNARVTASASASASADVPHHHIHAHAATTPCSPDRKCSYCGQSGQGEWLAFHVVSCALDTAGKSCLVSPPAPGPPHRRSKNTVEQQQLQQQQQQQQQQQHDHDAGRITTLQNLLRKERLARREALFSPCSVPHGPVTMADKDKDNNTNLSAVSFAAGETMNGLAVSFAAGGAGSSFAVATGGGVGCASFAAGECLDDDDGDDDNKDGRDDAEIITAQSQFFGATAYSHPTTAASPAALCALAPPPPREQDGAPSSASASASASALASAADASALYAAYGYRFASVPHSAARPIARDLVDELERVTAAQINDESRISDRTSNEAEDVDVEVEVDADVDVEVDADGDGNGDVYGDVDVDGDGDGDGEIYDEDAVDVTTLSGDNNVNDDGRQACSGCSRSFAPSALLVHARICASVFGTSRSPFPTRARRLRGTRAETFTSTAVPPCACGKKFPHAADARIHGLSCTAGRAALAAGITATSAPTPALPLVPGTVPRSQRGSNTKTITASMASAPRSGSGSVSAVSALLKMSAAKATPPPSFFPNAVPPASATAPMPPLAAGLVNLKAKLAARHRSTTIGRPMSKPTSLFASPNNAALCGDGTTPDPSAGGMSHRHLYGITPAPGPSPNLTFGITPAPNARPNASNAAEKHSSGSNSNSGFGSSSSSNYGATPDPSGASFGHAMIAPANANDLGNELSRTRPRPAVEHKHSEDESESSPLASDPAASESSPLLLNGAAISASALPRSRLRAPNGTSGSSAAAAARLSVVDGASSITCASCHAPAATAVALVAHLLQCPAWGGPTLTPPVPTPTPTLLQRAKSVQRALFSSPVELTSRIVIAAKKNVPSMAASSPENPIAPQVRAAGRSAFAVRAKSAVRGGGGGGVVA